MLFVDGFLEDLPFHPYVLDAALNQPHSSLVDSQDLYQPKPLNCTSQLNNAWKLAVAPSNQLVLKRGVGKPTSQEDLQSSHGRSLYTPDLNRTKGGLNDHATAINEIYRVRMIIAGKSPGVVQAGRNTLNIDSVSEEYTVNDVLKTASVFIEFENNREIEDSDCLPDTQLSPFDESQISEECNEDGLRYLAGWVAKKFLRQFPDLEVRSHKTKVFWIAYIDEFCFRATRSWPSSCTTSCAPRGSYCYVAISSCDKPHPHLLTSPSANLELTRLDETYGKRITKLWCCQQAAGLLLEMFTALWGNPHIPKRELKHGSETELWATVSYLHGTPWRRQAEFLIVSEEICAALNNEVLRADEDEVRIQKVVQNKIALLTMWVELGKHYRILNNQMSERGLIANVGLPKLGGILQRTEWSGKTSASFHLLPSMARISADNPMQAIVSSYTGRVPTLACWLFTVSGGAVARALASHHGDPGSIHAGFTPGFFSCGNRAGRCRLPASFFGVLPFPRPCIPAQLYLRISIHLVSGDDGHLRVPAGKPVTRRGLPRPGFPSTQGFSFIEALDVNFRVQWVDRIVTSRLSPPMAAKGFSSHPRLTQTGLRRTFPYGIPVSS
ncbi:hypothetical protein PR048_015216 [Dryococelus australis]|uniref:Transposable element P transposase-like C-terminal domain-containing protein n=1 Tax=Dryococelus australis TaxID=614101 RepID=A0ABQ9HHB5_9NEOP|nr:hypothetical protein PR048_015216 [Dryococelus australis]